jgi:hypothetical protein
MNVFTLVTASQLGAVLDCDINTGLQIGTGGTPTNNDLILNAFLALGVESSPVCLVMDGCTITAGIRLPPGGHASIVGCGLDTGFFMAAGSNSDVIRNAPAGPLQSDPGGPAATRGQNVALRNVYINGNRGNETNGNSNTGDPRGNSSAFPSEPRRSLFFRCWHTG